MSKIKKLKIPKELDITKKAELTLSSDNNFVLSFYDKKGYPFIAIYNFRLDLLKIVTIQVN